MKSARIDTLLGVPHDNASFQEEWTVRSQHGKRSLLLEFALFAGSVGPGLYMISCLNKFHTGLLVGFLIVLAGYGLPHMMFLGRIERFWRALLRPQSSWISRGFIFATLFLMFAFLSIAHYLPVVGDVGFLQKDSSLFSGILLLGFISALLLALYPGFLFSVLQAIPFWNSIILVPLLLVQALGGGIALTLILSQIPAVSGPRIEGLLPLEFFIIVATAALMGVYLYGRYKSGGAGKISVEQLIHGKYARLFFLGAVCCGLIMPLLLLAIASLGSGFRVLIVAAALSQLSGIVLFKYCLLNAGAYNELWDVRSLQSVR